METDYSANGWTKRCQILVGYTVSKVSYMSARDAKELGWSSRPLVITLSRPGSEDINIFSAADEEGNDAGAMFTDINDLDIIPRL